MSDETSGTSIPTVLRGLMEPRLAADALSWLDERASAVAGGAPARTLFMAFSACCRHASKVPLDALENERTAAEAARPGWDLSDWTEENTARTLLLLHLPSDATEAWQATVDRLLEAADMGEAEALYRSLPLWPVTGDLATRVAEGLRTNVTSVFTSIAHRNPVPAEVLDDAAWNQMVLKALFVEVPLAPIAGLDERFNADLARMLGDFAAERSAAGRPVPSDLTDLLARHADAAEVRP